ncbi:hypothetical protein [Pantanalinema sp. GBBB05]|uniref:hypothetical protein n=1 Tax=Pantanalinema sp. GBBB05 TaxID=2604139 RepID=UPI003D814236
MLHQGLLVTAVMLLGLGQPVVAQEPTPARVNMHPDPMLLQPSLRADTVSSRYQVPLTLQQALDLAKQHNHQLRSAEFQVERSRAQVQEAQSQNRLHLKIQGHVDQNFQP